MWTAVRNCLFGEYLQEESGLLHSQWDSIREGDKRVFFSSKQWSGLTWSVFVFFSRAANKLEWTVWRDGDRWGWGGDRDWTTDGDGWRSGLQSASVRGEQTLRWKRAVQQSSVQVEEGKAGPSQPCLPRGPPCLRRHEPSRVSNAIFTKAWKLLLLSLRLSCEGDQTQTDSFTGDTADHFTSINHWSSASLQHRLVDYSKFFWAIKAGSCKCLPPCFLLSSPFWSPFFGCSLGLWGCCGIEVIIRKMK